MREKSGNFTCVECVETLMKKDLTEAISMCDRKIRHMIDLDGSLHWRKERTKATLVQTLTHTWKTYWKVILQL